MPFDQDCIVIATWNNLEINRQVVINKAEAWSITRAYLLRGYSVVFSSALIYHMNRKGAK